MPGKTLECFFDFTSPSSYLASTRVEALAARTGAELRWRPFFLAGVLQATGNVPSAAVPHKAGSTRRALARWASHLGVPPRTPSPLPVAALLGNRVALGVQDSSHLEGGTA